jgi:hypothetical protein
MSISRSSAPDSARAAQPRQLRSARGICAIFLSGRFRARRSTRRDSNGHSSWNLIIERCCSPETDGRSIQRRRAFAHEWYFLRVPARSATPNRPSASSRRTISVRSWATRRPGPMGNIDPFPLPGGYSVVWTGMRVRKRNGTAHHGVGIAPNVRVSPTVAGVRAGRDEVLERAVALLARERHASRPPN